MKDLLEVLRDIRPEADFSASRDFLADGLLDSFDMVALVSALDSKYHISIDGAEIVPENFNSLERIAALLAKYGVKA